MGYVLRITNGFKNFLENQKSIPNKVKEELINKISKINENKEIEDFLYNQIKSTNLSSRKISKIFNKISLDVSYKTIVRITKKVLRPEEKKGRFPPPPRIPEDVREKIIADIKDPNSENLSDISRKYGYPTSTIGRISKKVLTPEEKKKRFPPLPKISKDEREKIIADIKDPNSGSQGDISKKHAVGINTIWTIAKKTLTPEDYAKRFPPPPKIPKKVRKKIIADIKNPNSGTQPAIAKKHGVNKSLVGRIVKKVLTLEEREKRFPPPPKIPEDIKENIIADIKDPNSGSQGDLAKKHCVSSGGIAAIAKKALTPEIYEKRFPPPPKIPKDVREKIKADIKDPNSGSQIDISKKHAVGITTIWTIAKEILTPEEYAKRFLQDGKYEIGNKTHKNIYSLVTEDFDKRRESSSDVPKIYSEPRIYLPLSEKRADLLFYNDTKFLQRLLKDLKDRNLLIPKLENLLKKLDRIKFVQFDFTNLLEKKNILDKILKYQHPEILTFIVGTKWYRFWDELTKELPNDKRIRYPENIIIISNKYFAELMKIKGIYKERFDEIIELNRKGDLDALKDILENDNQTLNGTDELIKDLKEKGYIKRDISEYIKNIKAEKPLDRFIYNEDKERNKESNNDDDGEDDNDNQIKF